MISVLVVEDDPVAAEAHREYVERVAGFTVAGVVHSGGAAVRFCERHHVDLVLLDFYLPDTHGLAVCRALRATGAPIDVIAVTSARDLAVVRGAVSAGVVQYLLKPFTFAALRQARQLCAVPPQRGPVRAGQRSGGHRPALRSPALPRTRGVTEGDEHRDPRRGHRRSRRIGGWVVGRRRRGGHRCRPGHRSPLS